MEARCPSIRNLGDAIQILGQRTNQSYIESILNVSECYTISEYSCPELDKYQKVLENDFYINIGLSSVIKPLANTITIPTTWFRFASKSQLTELGEHLSQLEILCHVIYTFKLM
uniref:Uncharacterized protein n=1 Tax=Lactuca sativa TaxID=4236 RepID=A0A9R1VB35_LACSA|nr:hypothetical protein LSAT_V11C600324730 [Lactuca sativa]